MAEDKPKRRIRKVETVRQRAEKAETPREPRKVRKVASTATGSLKTVGSVGRKQYHLIKLPDNKVGRFFGKSRKFTPGFLRNAWAELRQVTWPDRRETYKLTAAVLIFAIVFGGIIAITDYGLDKLFRQLLLK